MDTALPLHVDLKINRVLDEDKSIHDWYRFVLSFPPHLVREYLSKFEIGNGQCVLDPFAGTGTTLVEAKKQGISSIGIEANPVAHMASHAKISWNIDTDKFLNDAYLIAEIAERECKNSKTPKHLSEEADKLLIKNSISQLPLHKSLILVELISKYGTDEYQGLYKTAFARNLVYKYSNLKFGPEVGISRKKITDCDVIGEWLNQIKIMKFDLEMHKDNSFVSSTVFYSDSRNYQPQILPRSIDAVICSPPYPNEKDYTRTTRLESVLLGFMSCRKDLRLFKESLIRSNTRNVFKGDCDDAWIENQQFVRDLSKQIEEERIRLKKTSGFERLYHRVVTLYFGGMARHLEELKPALKKGAKLAYVVGDQASYFRIPIRTGQILEEIASELGYCVLGRDLFRTRYATVTKERLKEEVVLLQWKK